MKHLNHGGHDITLVAGILHRSNQKQNDQNPFFGIKKYADCTAYAPRDLRVSAIIFGDLLIYLPNLFICTLPYNAYILPDFIGLSVEVT